MICFGRNAAILTFFLTLAPGAATAQNIPQTFQATDTVWPDTSGPEWLDPGRRLVERIAWTPEAFDVTVLTRGEREPARRSVTFASARPSGNAFRDEVRMVWHPARQAPGPAAADPAAALRPAVVLVHSLHPGMVIAEALAKTLSQSGVEAFVVQLPGYGQRRGRGDRWPGIEAVVHAMQGVADVRRACDAVAALPGVDRDRIFLQGTSLGTFPAATAAGLGARHHGLVLLLGGGDLLNVLEHGEKDTANLRQALDHNGVDQQRRRDLLADLDPLNVAPQLDAQRVWLFSARFDQVIPPVYAQALSAAIGLDETHHRVLAGNHYTATFALPAIADFLVRLASAPGAPDPQP